MKKIVLGLVVLISLTAVAQAIPAAGEWYMNDAQDVAFYFTQQDDGTWIAGKLRRDPKTGFWDPAGIYTCTTGWKVDTVWKVGIYTAMRIQDAFDPAVTPELSIDQVGVGTVMFYRTPTLP